MTKAEQHIQDYTRNWQGQMILDLPLKAKWYDMIESGEKREEYREIKPYWMKRLLFRDGQPEGNMIDPYLSFKPYTQVRFRYGYTKLTMLFRIDSITIGIGNPKLGAPTDKEVFIIRLGEKQ